MICRVGRPLEKKKKVNTPPEGRSIPAPPGLLMLPANYVTFNGQMTLRPTTSQVTSAGSIGGGGGSAGTGWPSEVS